MIGTTRFMNDSVGNPGEEAVFTAFGQRIDGDGRRFGYAGEWGYQSTLDDQTPPAEVFPFLHVGARYYDPATGRFLQRDPIGIAGSINVYGYVDGRPTSSVDPEGLHNDPSGPYAGCGFGGACRPAEPGPDVGGMGPGYKESAKRAGKYLIVACFASPLGAASTIIAAGAVAAVDLYQEFVGG